MSRLVAAIAAVASLAALAFAPPAHRAAAAEGKVDFAKEVQPLLAESCLRCHGAPDTQDPRKKSAGGLRLDDKAAAMKGGKSGKAIVPGKAKESLLYKLLQGPAKVGGREVPQMPKAMGKESKALEAEKVELIRKWIDEGAAWPKEQPLEFTKDVQPVLAESCGRCHGAPDQKEPRKKAGGGPGGGLRVDDKAALLRGGRSGKAIVPGKAKESLLYKLLQGPAKAGGREIAQMPKAMRGESKPLAPEKVWS